MDAIKKAGYEKEVKIGMDVAASEFLLPSGGYDFSSFRALYSYLVSIWSRWPYMFMFTADASLM